MLVSCFLFLILSLALTHSTESIHSNHTISVTSYEDNPCVHVMPNFRRPGKRISQVKCDEYVWERLNREKLTQKSDACKAFERKTGIVHEFAIGGRNALPGEFPHMGALGWKAAKGTWIFKCGSTLISPKFTLTAAHCSKTPPDPKTISQVPEIVRFGDKNILELVSDDEPPTDDNIVRIILHPRYSAPSKYYDIALVEIAHIFQFSSNLQPACLWNKFDTSRLGSKATLTGWGVIDTATQKTSPILQAAVVDIIDSKQCSKLLQHSCNRWWCGFQDHQICGGILKGGVDACQGDSGGPLQVKIPLPPSKEGSMHFVIGVTSFGAGCGIRNLPGVYTRVSSFVNWIESIVWPKELQ